MDESLSHSTEWRKPGNGGQTVLFHLYYTKSKQSRSELLEVSMVVILGVRGSNWREIQGGLLGAIRLGFVLGVDYMVW